MHTNEWCDDDHVGLEPDDETVRTELHTLVDELTPEAAAALLGLCWCWGEPQRQP
jgi:hypothetical protein